MEKNYYYLEEFYDMAIKRELLKGNIIGAMILNQRLRQHEMIYLTNNIKAVHDSFEEYKQKVVQDETLTETSK